MACMTWIRYFFLGSVALIAVHIVDDSFLQPEAGTHAADHLVGGLGTLVLLALATWVYLRARAGVGAAIALVLGLFALVVSGEGWYAATTVGPAADDYTGIPVLAAALGLLVVGVVTLWRSRRREGGVLRIVLRRAAIGAASAVTLVLVVQPFLMTYAYTHISRAAVPDVELGDAEYVDVSFETSDGLTLHGWYLPSRNGAAVIAWAGRTHAQDAARFLSEEGYGVLLYDRRGEAASEGDPNALGWDRATDVQAGIDFLQSRAEVDPERIGGIGYSVGGEMLLEAAAESDDLKAVVSEGAGIRSYKEGLELEGVQKWIQLPVWVTTTVGVAFWGNSTPPANLEELVGEIAPRPVLFIYAERGTGGEELNPVYHDAASSSAGLWQTESSHVSGYDADPDTYRQRVVDFFDAALLEPATP